MASKFLEKRAEAAEQGRQRIIQQIAEEEKQRAKNYAGKSGRSTPAASGPGAAALTAQRRAEAQAGARDRSFGTRQTQAQTPTRRLGEFTAAESAGRSGRSTPAASGPGAAALTAQRRAEAQAGARDRSFGTRQMQTQTPTRRLGKFTAAESADRSQIRQKYGDGIASVYDTANRNGGQLSADDFERVLDKYRQNRFAVDANVRRAQKERAESTALPAWTPQRYREQSATGNVIADAQRRAATRVAAASPYAGARFGSKDQVLGGGRPLLSDDLKSEQEIFENWDRWAALANLDRPWTEEERQEAKRARETLNRTTNQWTGIRGLGVWANDDGMELWSEIQRRSGLSNVLENRDSALASGWGNFLNQATHLVDAANLVSGKSAPYLTDFYDSAELAEALDSPKKMLNASSEAHPVASTLGSVAGDVTGFLALGEAVKGMTGLSSLGEVAKLSGKAGKVGQALKNMVDSGLTFGLSSVLDSIGSWQSEEEFNTQEQKRALEAQARGETYTPREYNVWNQLVDFLGKTQRKAVASTAGGIVGSGLSQIIGEAGAKLLTKYGMQTKFWEVVRRTLSDFGFSIGEQGTEYLMLPEDERPSGQEIVQGLATDFIFSTITGAVDTVRASKKSKKALEDAVDNLKSYCGYMDRMSMNPDLMETAGRNLKAYTGELRKALRQNYYAGQQKTVDKILDCLDALDDQVDISLAGARAGGASAGAGTASTGTALSALPASAGGVDSTGTARYNNNNGNGRSLREIFGRSGGNGGTANDTANQALPAAGTAGSTTGTAAGTVDSTAGGQPRYVPAAGRSAAQAVQGNAAVSGVDAGGYRGISADGQVQQTGAQGGYYGNQGVDSGRVQQSGDTGGTQLLSEPTQAALRGRGTEPIAMRTATGGEEFHAAISQAKQTNPHGAYVTAYDAADYGGMKTFLSDNGKTGIAVKPDGDIVSVFNSPDSGNRNALRTLLPFALEQGGNKLDNYDGNLSRMYEQYGFEPVAKVKFDPAYAPADWNYERDGQPDIIFWAHNGDSAETVAANIGSYPVHDLTQVPYFDSYDVAAAYRDGVIAQRNNTVGVGNVSAGTQAAATGTQVAAAGARSAAGSVSNAGSIQTQQPSSDAGGGILAPAETGMQTGAGNVPAGTGATATGTQMAPVGISNAGSIQTSQPSSNTGGGVLAPAETNAGTEVNSETDTGAAGIPMEIPILDTDTEQTAAAKLLMNILSNRYGVRFRPVRLPDGSRIGGYYNRAAGEICINENAEDPMFETVAHDFAHAFQDIDPEGYAILRRITESDLNLARFYEYKKSLLEAYDLEGIDYSQLGEDELNALVLEEAISDLMVETMRDPETIERIAMKDKSLARRIVEWLQGVNGRIKNAIRSYSSKGSNEVRSLVENFEQVKDIYQEVIARSEGKLAPSAGSGENATLQNGGIRYSANPTDTETLSIKDQIRAKLDEINQMEIVASESVEENISKESARQRALDKYGKLDGNTGVGSKDYTIVRNNFGEVKIGKKQVSEALRYLDSPAERAALLTVPEVIKYGKEVGNNQNHKGRSYKTFTFVAPVEINGQKGIQGVVVKRTDGNRYKTHRVLNPDGSVFTFSENENSGSSNGMTSVSESDSPSYTTVFDSTILQRSSGVKGESMQNGEKDTPGIDLGRGDRARISRYDRAQESMKKYRESNDAQDLPSRAWAKGYERDANAKDHMLQNQIDTLEYEMEHSAQTDELQKRLDALKAKQSENRSNVETSRELVGLIESENVKRNYDLAGIIDDLTDADRGILGKLQNGNYHFNDMYRNMQRVFGKHFDVVKPLLDDFDAAKGDYAQDTVEILSDMYSYVQKELGIRKGSRESKAVQWIAEGERNPDKNRKSDMEALRKMGITDTKKLDPNLRVPYTEEQLSAEFGEKTAKNILAAEQWFREKYDALIEQINRAQRQIYPNRPDKLVPKRKDYMRHFREISDGFAGLVKIFGQDNNISADLSGISRYTKPKEKWASIKQERKGKQTEEGAVEGFLDYIGQAEYAIHINQYIDQFRGLARDLAQLKEQDGKTDLNGFINYLNEFANDLAGKTCNFDRDIVSLLGSGGRSLLKALAWFNNRTKANAVLGNVSSVAKQVMNLPNGMILLDNPANILTGILDVFKGALPERTGVGADVRSNYKKSRFLTERLGVDRAFGRFEKNTFGKMLTNLLGVADEFGSRAIWNAAYREAVKRQENGEKIDPVSVADSLTRRAVAGRGIGEVPLAYKSQIGKLALAFQLEVNNSWNVLRDVMSGYTKKGKLPDWSNKAWRILLLYLVSWGMNAALKTLVGSEGGFDPIGDIVGGVQQGFMEKEDGNDADKIGRGALRSVQNLAGDFLGNRSFGWVVGSLMEAVSDEWSLKFFNDSIYQAQGVNVPAIQSLAKTGKKLSEENWVGAAAEFISSFVLPYGGKQLDKSFRGGADYLRGGNYNSDIYQEWSSGERGSERYPIERGFENFYKSFVFGPNAVTENESYWLDRNLEKYAQEESAAREKEAVNAFISDYRREHPDDEVVRLYRETKNKEVFPYEMVEPIKFTSAGQKYTIEMTAEEMEQYQQKQNRAMAEEYEAVIDTPEYQSADAQGKKALLKEARSSAKSAVKDEIKREYKKKHGIK